MVQGKNLHSNIGEEYDNADKKEGIFFKKVTKQKDQRKILSQIPDKQLPDNHIVTNKYNLLTFIPLNLFDQFSKLANFYFLFIGLLQMIPSISISEGKPVMYLPLSIVLTVSALKDALEDYKKYKQDQIENNKKIVIVDETHDEKEVKWRELYCGNIVKINRDQEIPADILLIHSSDKKGQAFIETKNLDGETNLKRKLTPKKLQGNKSEDKIKFKKYMHVRYERPNPYIYNFQGATSVDNQDGDLQEGALDSNNFLLRGCSLKNTESIYGLVLYTGHDTKIMLNTVKQKPKHSSVEKKMNQCIQLIFAIQVVMTLATSIYGITWTLTKWDNMPYLGEQEQSDFSLFMQKWGTWILIFTNFVPISLIVSLELVKFIQAYFISEDPHCYSEKYDIKPNAQVSGVNEELGQVAYIFSDKTGTLTSNVMNFKNIIARGKSYGNENTITKKELEANYPKVSNVQFYDRHFLEQSKKYFQDNKETYDINSVLTHLAICHTIQVEEINHQLEYQASSPDELALVNFARMCGVEYQGIDENDVITLKYQKKEYYFKLLHVLEFTSARKRMSVIVKDLEDQKIYLYCKGADNIIEGISKTTEEQYKTNEIEKTQNHLKNYAIKGLRTLLLAKKEISQLQYEDWAAQYQQAATSLIDRDMLMEQSQALIEQELEIIGATAIEDQLQDEVGETIQALKETGINLWVLTGDKVETAVNIGKSCQLLVQGQPIVYIEQHDPASIQHEIQKGLQKVQQTTNCVLVITGQALIQISKNEDQRKQLMDISDMCSSVIACRVSPKQKQEIVKLVRQYHPTKTTLAIGDGANDVNMITGAHVGIGIQGVEGQQAARASDYSIGEFKFLRNLVMYHGRECYRKNTTLIGYNFYKNILLVCPQWFYGFLNGFSATPLYDPWLYQMYNIFYTNFPILVYAIFDREFSQNLLVHQPQLYQKGLKGQLFNLKRFSLWLGIGFWQSFFLGIFTFLLLEDNFFSSEGYNLFFSSTGMICYWISIVLANLRIFAFSKSHSIGSITIIFLSIMSYIITYGIVSVSLKATDVYNTLGNQLLSLNFYLITFALLSLTYGLDYAVSVVNRYKDKVKQQNNWVLQIGNQQGERININYNSNNNNNHDMVSLNNYNLNDVQSSPPKSAKFRTDIEMMNQN